VRRVGIFGWGVVAPKSPNIESFEKNLEGSESWLSAFDGFGPNNFLVGTPEFRFADYKGWIDERFPPNRFSQLEKKMGAPTLYAIGAFIQSLRQNPGIEQVLAELGTEARVYVGTGLGDLPTTYDISVGLHRAQRRWDRFWANPERNTALQAWLALPEEERRADATAPPEPSTVDEPLRDQAEEAFWRHWASHSPELHEYLAELREIEGLSVEGDVESAKLAVIKEKRIRTAKLQRKWQAPEPPWSQVSSNLLWNIHNTPASQVSMMGKITGMTFAPVAACSSFGFGLRLGMDAIRAGDAKAVVVGMTDPPPHPLSVGAFYNGRVLAADGQVSKPLTGMRGTHVAGGSVLWILGDWDYMTAKGFQPLGMEPLSVGVSADADHIITPSKEGPTTSIQDALAAAGASPADLGTWDLHATATPGDYLEVETLRGVLPESVLIAARKGIFGHGMSAGGGWELTAQYLGYAKGSLAPTPLGEDELNQEIARLHERFVFDHASPAPQGLAGKLSMGIGGINACVISRPL
jgi:3-oxoacyl-(acyl-carrier-protein) synthase